VDDDGTGYFIYTSINEGYTVRVERLTPDYLGATGQTSSVLVTGAEAPVLFRRKNLYYTLCGPCCAFCPEGSEVRVLISYSPMGPFYEAPNINRRPESGGPTEWTNQTWTVDIPGGKVVIPLTNKITYQYNAPVIPAQETWVAKIPTTGEPAFFWMADRWQSTPDGIKGHDFQFWSAPLRFRSDGSIEPVKNIARWDIIWGTGN
jgi:beta-xylosidase